MSKPTISTFELFQMFPDAESARAYLEQKRWPNGATCPACSEVKRVHARKGGFYRCNACLNDFTVRTATIFERSKVLLNQWIYTMHLLATNRKDISSVQLAEQIGVTQKTAWFVLHRLREACGNDATKLAAVVDCDEDCAAMDAITNAVLAYRPAKKGQAAAKIERRVRDAETKEKKANQNDQESSI